MARYPQSNPAESGHGRSPGWSGNSMREQLSVSDSCGFRCKIVLVVQD